MGKMGETEETGDMGEMEEMSDMGIWGSGGMGIWGSSTFLICLYSCKELFIAGFDESLAFNRIWTEYTYI